MSAKRMGTAAGSTKSKGHRSRAHRDLLEPLILAVFFLPRGFPQVWGSVPLACVGPPHPALPPSPRPPPCALRPHALRHPLHSLLEGVVSCDSGRARPDLGSIRGHSATDPGSIQGRPGASLGSVREPSGVVSGSIRVGLLGHFWGCRIYRRGSMTPDGCRLQRHFRRTTHEQYIRAPPARTSMLPHVCLATRTRADVPPHLLVT